MSKSIIARCIAGLLLVILAACGAQQNEDATPANKLLASTATVDNFYEPLVHQLYISYFGRPADRQGLANFKAQLAALNSPLDIQGLNQAYQTKPALRALVDSFGASAESAALYPGDNTALVTAIYKNILNRTPDAEGLAFWAGAINRGTLTKANASLSIMAGAMNNTSTQGKVDAALINRKVLVSVDFNQLLEWANSDAYRGAAAAAQARDLLASVTPTTDTIAFYARVKEVVNTLGNPTPPVTPPVSSPYQVAFDACYVNTPPLYTVPYCTAYADAIVAGNTPSVANQHGAAAAGSNVGNIGMGGTVTATGTSTFYASYLDRPGTNTVITCEGGSKQTWMIPDSVCRDKQIAAITTNCAGASVAYKTVLAASLAASVCYANNSIDPARSRFVASANYTASQLGQSTPRYAFAVTPPPATVWVYELGVSTVNSATSNPRLTTSCLKLPSPDSYKLIFDSTYYYHSMYGNLSSCEAAGSAWVASGGRTPAISVAQFKQSTGGGSASGELAAHNACAAQPYLGGANDPQFDSFAKIAQLDACLHRAGYTQYDVEGRANCKILDDLLRGTGSTWRSPYCPYPY